jgi:hypothetical protein
MEKLLVMAILVSVAMPTWAAKIKNPKCEEITTVKDQYTPEYMAVVDGYNKAGKKEGEVLDVSGIVTESTQVKEVCNKMKSKSIDSVRKDVAKKDMKNKTTKNMNSEINPVKATCEEFLALDTEYQPVAAYWVAGHDKSGKTIKSGEVDEAFLAEPVLALVEECRANPKASFYSQAKSWFSKRL